MLILRPNGVAEELQEPEHMDKWEWRKYKRQVERDGTRVVSINDDDYETIKNKIKMKPCKGINKAKGYGCGEVVSHRTYGLCHKCFKSWLFETSAGELEIAKRTLKVKKDRIQEERKRIKKKKEELLTVQDWIKIAQQAFNSYIRERDKNQPCISCGNKLKGKYDAGHYYSAGGHYALRFDEENVHGQCVACNQHKHGNLQRYREGILRRLDARILDRLDKASQETRKFTRDELKDITKHYKQKLKELRDEKAN